MTISQALRLLASPTRLSAYLRLRRERKERYTMLQRVTSTRSIQDLHDKIRTINEEIADL